MENTYNRCKWKSIIDSDSGPDNISENEVQQTVMSHGLVGYK